MCKSLFFLPLTFLFVACASTQQQQQETVSRGVYAVHDSLKSGRVELAQSYSQELTKLVPAPAKRLKIAPVAPATPKEAQNENRQLEVYSQDVERLKAETIKQAGETKQTLWGSLKQTYSFLKFLTGFGGLAIAIGLVALVVFVPGALPVVLNLAGVAWALLKKAGGILTSITLKLLEWVKGKVGK